MPSITYPITKDYRSQWTIWDGLREAIYQEYLDLFKDWRIARDNGLVVVEGHGASLNLYAVSTYWTESWCRIVETFRTN